MRIVWSRRAIRHLVSCREHTNNGGASGSVLGRHGALAPLFASQEHIEKDAEQSAALVAGRSLEAVDLLESHPELGRPGRLVGTRELIVAGTPYIIPYRVRGESLELIAVFHGRQKWPSKL